MPDQRIFGGRAWVAGLRELGIEVAVLAVLILIGWGVAVLLSVLV